MLPPGAAAAPPPSAAPRKGSQLKQLKQSLRQSGLSRTAAASSATASSKNKKRRSSISANLSHPDFRQQKLAEIQASQNLFDSKTSKVKFPTANQTARARQSTHATRLGAPEKPKLTRTVGNPAQSATQAHQTRVEKLLPEYLNRHKSSQFLDKRFGETDSNLTPEEKALERFTREKQDRSSRARRRNVFNLDDGGEGLYDDGQFGDNTTLTHGGIHLDLGDNVQDEDENEPESIFNRRQQDSEHAPRETDPGSDADQLLLKKKSKAEVMSEIIAKSKVHKYQRQMMKDKDDQLRDELNEEFKEIRGLLCSLAPSTTRKGDDHQPDLTHVAADSNQQDSPPEHNNHLNPEPNPKTDVEEKQKEDGQVTAILPQGVSSQSKVDRALLETLIGSSSREASPEAENRDEDAYDRFVRELAFDARAKPTDRLKTGEEAALEEAERLRELELQRLKRMRGEEGDEEDEDEDEDTRSGKKTNQNRNRRKPQADDLEDDFFPGEEVVDEVPSNLGTGLRPDGAFGAGASHGEDEEGSEDASEDSKSGDSDEEDQEDDDSDVDDGHDSPEEVLKKIEPLVSTKPHTKNKRPKLTNPGTNELAYTFPCPTSHADFLSIISSASVGWSDLPMVVQRIRVLYHPSLAEGNKEKLANLTNVLIDHLIYISSQPLPAGPSFTALINGLLPHLIALCKSNAQTSASHFVTKLVLMHKNLNHALAHPNINGWPGGSELFLLRLVGLVWSTSDFSHPVAAPALLLINQYLNQLKVKQFTDLLSGLFLCTLVLQYETHSKRFVPEVINFLVLTVLRMVFSTEEIEQLKCMIPVIEGSQLVLFSVNDKPQRATLRPQTMDFASIFNNSNTPLGNKESDQDLVNAFDVTLSLLGNFSQVYGSLGLYPEVFSTVVHILKSIDLRKNITAESSLRITELIESIEAKIKATNRERRLNPIKLQSHRPVPVKSQQPQFELDFNPNAKKFNPDTSAVEMNKLKHLVRKEKKGAIRELRKDNKFLAMAKSKEKEESDLQYTSKMAKITASLQEERSQEKKAERLKSKLKKLDKAKSQSRR